MKVKWDTELKTLDGEVITEVGSKEKQTLRRIATFAVLTVDSEQISGKERYERYELAKELKAADDDTDFSVDDIAKIKELIGKAPRIGVVIIGRCWDILEGGKEE